MADGAAVLIDSADSYTALRKASGFGMRTLGPLVRDFARFADCIGDIHVVTTSALQWALRSRSPGQREARMRAVIGFARHLHAEDKRHEVPPHGVFAAMHTRRPPPFIFSPQQISDLVQQAYLLRGPGASRPQTYATLISLLACTGMRISEALGLLRSDITDDGLVVRETKFHKSRLLPLHPTAAAGLERYLPFRIRYPGDHLFVQAHGGPLVAATVARTFAGLLRAVGIVRTAGPPHAHLHSLRHTFAVRALEACPYDRLSVGRHQVALMTYLGHSRISSTYWYLQATPNLLRDIAARCEASLKELR